MKQAEIWDVSFHPTKGSEQAGLRPAVVISGNVMNDNFNLVIVCPLTSVIKNFRSNIILHPNKKNGLTERSELVIFQISAVAKIRLKRKRGSISAEELSTIKSNLNNLLNY